MTDNKHPITPPPELVQQWRRGGPADAAVNNAYERHIATQAARWGADRELDECCHLLRLQGFDVVDDLRATRRPRPLSLKKRALKILEEEPDDMKELIVFDTGQVKIIRLALEQLND